MWQPARAQVGEPGNELPVQQQPALADPSAPGASPPLAEMIGPDGEDDSALVMKKNMFTYDSAEGRDPFKIYRDPIIVPTGTTTDNNKGSGNSGGPINLEKNIRTALVPSEVTVLGILYKKVDPIALVAVKGVKGLNKLKVNSPIGRNEGKVIEIRKDQIVIEQVKDFDGQKFTEKVVLKVRNKKD